jgi:solute carrier family 50 protein (sugar transporter)
MYGAAKGNPFVFAGNILGITCSVFYMLSTYGLADDSTRRRIEKICLPLTFVSTILAFLYTLLGHDIGTIILGYWANVIVLLMFGSPLTAAAKVITSKCSASINRPFGIVQVLNCIIWTAYAAYVADWYLMVPNAIGLFFGLIQVVLMCVYPAKLSPEKQAEMQAEEHNVYAAA